MFEVEEEKNYNFTKYIRKPKFKKTNLTHNFKCEWIKQSNKTKKIDRLYKKRKS